jgi:transcriptional regulator CtsR
MGNLADKIEQHLKNMLGEATEGFVILQRCTLADTFSCAPSQINYVLTTRFTIDKGYMVESRRGGGGYVRIIRLSLDTEGKFQQLMSDLIGEELSQERCRSLVERLLEDDVFTLRESIIIKSIMSGRLLREHSGNPDRLRAEIFKEVLANICRDDVNE